MEDSICFHGSFNLLLSTSMEASIYLLHGNFRLLFLLPWKLPSTCNFFGSMLAPIEVAVASKEAAMARCPQLGADT